MRTPNFFIVGAFKSGTTALAEYLREHPRIFMSLPKEPHYFAAEFPKQQVVSDEAGYRRLFHRATAQHLAIGEASTSSLYASQAMQKIRQFNGDAKIIVMLRNPVDLIHSFHSHLLFSLQEDQTDFSQAWQMQELRAGGESLPQYCRTPEFLQYRRVGLLGEQLERVYDNFPCEQVHVVFYEDFASDNRGVYQEVLRFLNVPDDRRTNFRVVNQAKRQRFPQLANLWMRRPRLIHQSIATLKTWMGPRYVVLQRLWQGLYATSIQRQRMTPQMRQTLLAEFDQDIGKLAELTGRDLTHWRTPMRLAA